jgi:hypothetical protein
MKCMQSWLWLGIIRSHVQLFNAVSHESVKERKQLEDSIKKTIVWGHLLQDLKADFDKKSLSEAHQIVLFRMGGFKDRTWLLLRQALIGIRLYSCTSLREMWH